jgi:hypothetical protein
MCRRGCFGLAARPMPSSGTIALHPTQDMGGKTNTLLHMRYVFLDESSTTDEHFMVIGCVIVPGPVEREAEALVVDCLNEHRTVGELKWTKVSRSKAHVYTDVLRRFWQYAPTRGIECHSIIVDTHQIDHGAYNDGDPELGFNKFVFQLLHHHVGRTFGETERIVAHLDARTTTREPAELQTILNNAAARHFGEMTHRPFGKVTHRDSKSSRLLQIADLLSGAIAWHKNDRDTRPEASPAKTELANELARITSRARLGGNSRHPQMNTWNFKMRPRGGAR